MENNLTEERKPLILDLYQRGRSIKELSAEFHICNKHLSSFLKEQGMQIRGSRLVVQEKIPDIIKMYSGGATMQSVARSLGIGSSTVKSVLVRERVPFREDTLKGGPNKLTEDQREEVVQRYSKGENSVGLGKIYGVSQTTIWRTLKVKGVSLRSISEAKRTHIADWDYFESIDGQEKAYWLGFLVADGTISDSSVVLALASKDRDHLVEFRNSLRSDHLIHDVQTYLPSTGRTYQGVRVQITSRKMVDDLAKWGIVPRKSMKTYYPEIDNGLDRHFIRGVFDGDGFAALYWRFSLNRQRGKYYMCRKTQFTITGNSTLLEGIRDRFCEVGLRRRPLTPYKNKDCFDLKYFTIEDLRIIHDHLYRGASVYLNRKKRLFDRVVSDGNTCQSLVADVTKPEGTSIKAS